MRIGKDMRYIVFDLETTCWELGRSRHEMETIEIGGIQYVDELDPIADEFQTYVRPNRNPQLSPFCTKLTSITQRKVENAPRFQDAFRQFENWIGPGPVQVLTWGATDIEQFKVDCDRYKITLPNWAASVLNLKSVYANRVASKPIGLGRALESVGLEVIGTDHRAIDDARNIARLARVLLGFDLPHRNRTALSA